MAVARYPARQLVGQVGRRIVDGVSRDVRASVRGWLARRHGDAACGAEPTDFDPLDPQVIRDPYPWYRQLVGGSSLQYSERRRVWIIARYDEVRAAAQAHSQLSSAEGVIFVRRSLPMLLTMDRPEHGRLRRIVARHFTHEALDLRRAAIEAIVGEAVERLVNAGEVDAVAELATPVPVDVIAELLGVPRADRARFRKWSDQIVVGFNLAPGNLIRASASVLPAIFRLHAYFTGAFQARAGGAPDDLLSHLLRSSDEGQLNAEELFWFALLLLVAGNETTTNLLGTLLLALAQRPEDYQRLRTEPELIPSAIEESLRLHCPIQAFYRTAVTDYEVGEATVPAGGRVLLVFAAANRDPLKYEQPEDYVIDRNPTDHLAFGSGIHFCLGAHLARLEAALTLQCLIERVAALELVGTPVWTRNPALRGMQELPLRLRSNHPNVDSPAA
jgi:cytochrome P450